jgi:hypothetical protein
MVRLEYKSLVTKEIIDHYLSIIKDEREKKDFINIISKFDIRISTKPVIKDEEYYYYKIWIWRRGTQKRAHIKQYNTLESLKKEEKSKTKLPGIRYILNRIRVYANVPDDFEEYCEISLRDPSDEISRSTYPAHLKRAERFKKFITKEEILSIPFLSFEYKDNPKKDEETNDFFDLDDESDLVSLPVIYLKDKREYDKLVELQSILKYNSKIVKSYGYDPYTGDIDTKKFPITKEDKQMDTIANNFKNYFNTISEYNDYLKELIKKYNIKPTGNLVQRFIFHIHNDIDNTNSKQQQDLDFKYIMVAINWADFFPDS